MDITNFLDTYYSDANKSTRTWVTSTVSKIKKNGESLENSINDISWIIACFSGNTRPMSRTQHHKIKEVVTNLWDYYKINLQFPTHKEFLASIESSIFFRDLQSIYNHIDKIAGFKIVDYSVSSSKELVRIKSLAGLLWYDYTVEEIVGMNRFSLLEAIDDKCFVCFNGCQTEIDKETYRILKKQSAQDFLSTFPNGKIYSYKVESSSVFRNRNGSEQNADEIYHIFSVFNKDAISKDTLSIQGIKMSRLFYDVCEDNSSNDIVEKIVKHKNCTKNFAYIYKRQYDKWYEKFHK